MMIQHLKNKMMMSSSSYCSDHHVPLLQQQHQKQQEQEQLPPDDDRITITTSRFYVQYQYNHPQMNAYKQFDLIGIQEKKMKKRSRVFSHEYYFERSSVQLSLAILSNGRVPPSRKNIPLNCKHRCTPSLKYSYQGFLVLTGDTNDHKVFTMFYNPVTEQQVTVRAPQRYIFCGIYFHSPTQEYRQLYRVLGRADPNYDPRYNQDDGSSSSIGYYAVRGLRTRLLRRITSNFSHTPSCRANFPPNCPVILNGAIHWMGTMNNHERNRDDDDNSDLVILLFMIESEEFHVMPHPEPDCDKALDHHARMVPLSSKHGYPPTRHYHKKSLMEMEGKLCFCDHCCCDNNVSAAASSYCVRHKIDIWVLEDYEQRIWVKRHVVKHETLAPLWKLPDVRDRDINALFINNNNNGGGSSTDHDDAELVLESITEHKQYCIFYLYHLKKGTLRRLEVPCSEERRPTDQVEYVENIVDFHPSLISLNNQSKCKENHESNNERRSNPSVVRAKEECEPENISCTVNIFQQRVYSPSGKYWQITKDLLNRLF